MSRFEELTVGDIIAGTVDSLVPFGAFVRIADDGHGLLPGASKLAVNDEIRVRVVEIDPARRRARLAEA